MIRKLLVATALCVGVSYAAKAQNPAFDSYNIDYTDSCSFSPDNPGITQFLSGNIADYVTGMTVTTFWGDGTSSNATPNANENGYFFDTHFYLLPGNYTVTSILSDGSSTNLDTITRTIQAICNTIWGYTYMDNNANCSFDGGDIYLSNMQEIEVQENGTPIDTFTITFGNFWYNIPNPNLAATYTLQPINVPSGFTLSCPTTDYTFTLSNIVTQTFNFGYQCDASVTGYDLSAFMSGWLRIVANSYLNISLSNNACSPQDGVVTLDISPKYSFNSASITPTSVSGNTVTWNIDDLSASHGEYISVTLDPVGTLTEGDTATHIVTINPTTVDVNPANNVYVYTDTLRASMDPNEKKVSPSGYIDEGQELTYTVNFENLGNDTAFNIHVIDTLSSDLVYNTFELLSSSHRISVNHFETSTGIHTVRFDFKDIKLASAANPETNKGFFIYRIKAKDALADGTQIKNTAHIFFDINPAVITNTTVNTMGDEPNAISQLNKEDGIAVYPNPADNVLNIDNKEGSFSKATIINAVGQNMKSQAINKGSNTIDISGINSGLYYLLINGKKGARMLKFVVK